MHISVHALVSAGIWVTKQYVQAASIQTSWELSDRLTWRSIRRLACTLLYVQASFGDWH